MTAYAKTDFDPNLFTRDDGLYVFLNPATPTPETDALNAWLAAGNTPLPAHARTPRVSTEQFILAMRDLNVLAAWQLAVSKAKASDQARVALNGKETILHPANPVLTRIAALAVPPIDLHAVFVQAQSE